MLIWEFSWFFVWELGKFSFVNIANILSASWHCFYISKCKNNKKVRFENYVQKKAEERWGAGVVEQVSLDLQKEFPNSTNFSTRNLWYMKQWYLFYTEESGKLKQAVSELLPDGNYGKKLHQLGGEQPVEEKLKQVVSEFPLPFACVPWGHHVRIVQHSKTIEEALFYIGYTLEEGISREVLERIMADDFFHKRGKSSQQFSATSHTAIVATCPTGSEREL